MAVGRINGVAALTGFYYKKMYGRFAGTKQSGRINEVAVRRGSTVLVTRAAFCTQALLTQGTLPNVTQH